MGCVPAANGMPVTAMIEAASAEKMKAMYIVGENLATLGFVADALGKLDFLVVQDLFLTETAEKAHVVPPPQHLPSATAHSPTANAVSSVSGKL